TATGPRWVRSGRRKWATVTSVRRPTWPTRRSENRTGGTTSSRGRPTTGDSTSGSTSSNSRLPVITGTGSAILAFGDRGPVPVWLLSRRATDGVARGPLGGRPHGSHLAPRHDGHAIADAEQLGEVTAYKEHALAAGRKFAN